MEFIKNDSSLHCTQIQQIYLPLSYLNPARNSSFNICNIYVIIIVILLLISILQVLNAARHFFILLLPRNARKSSGFAVTCKDCQSPVDAFWLSNLVCKGVVSLPNPWPHYNRLHANLWHSVINLSMFFRVYGFCLSN